MDTSVVPLERELLVAAPSPHGPHARYEDPSNYHRLLSYIHRALLITSSVSSSLDFEPPVLSSES